MVDKVKATDVQGEPHTGEFVKFGKEEPQWWASGIGWITLPDGSHDSAYGTTRYLRNGITGEANAIERWRQSVADAINASRERTEIRNRWQAAVERVASPRLSLSGWAFNRGTPQVGEVVKVWGYGGFRLAVVVEVTKSRAKVAWVTPNNPDLHVQMLGMGKVARALPGQAPVVSATILSGRESVRG